MAGTRNQVTDMYTAMLRNDSIPVSSQMQHQIRRYAEDSGATSLLVLLLGRADVDRALEEELSRSSDLEVLSAWAGSPRRTAKELSDRMRSEKRVNALLPLARRPGLPPEVYRTLAENGSVRLSEALLENRSTPKDVRVDCIRFLVSRPTWGTSRTPYSLKSWLLSEDEARAVAEHAVDLSHLKVAAESSHLPDDAGDALARQTYAAAQSMALADRPWWSMGSLASILASMRRFSLSEESRELCLKLVDIMADMPSHYWSRREHSPDRLREAFGGEADGFSSALRALSSASPGEVPAAAARLLAAASDAEDKRIAVEALAHVPGVPDRVFQENFRNLTQQSATAMFCTLLAEGRLELLADLSRSLYVNGEALSALESSPDAEQLVRMVADSCREAECALPPWAREMLRRDRFAELALETLSWPELSELLSRYAGGSFGGGGARLSRLIQEHLQAELGDDQDLWRMFSEIGASFSGSLPMLTDAVKAIRA